jgi:hypothetical protein
MRRLFLNRLSLVWLILVGVTALSWEAGHGALSDLDLARAAVIGVAFFKVRYVILDFMEIRHAPVAMRMVGEIWAVSVCAVLIGLYVVPR